MRNWQIDAPRMIAEIHKAMPGCSPDELRKELRKHSLNFSCGTSWGKKVWSKHCRIYLQKLTGNPQSAAVVVEWPDDIAFPFQAQATPNTDPRTSRAMKED